MADLQKIALEVNGEVFDGEYSELRAKDVGLRVDGRYRHVYEIFEGEKEFLGGIRKRVTVNHMATIFLTDSIDGYLNEDGTLVLAGEDLYDDLYEGVIRFVD